MPAVADRHDAPTAIQSNLAAIFISLELSRSIWLVTSLSPGSAEKMSKHSVGRGRRGAAGALFGAEAEGVRADRKILSRSLSFTKRVSTASGFIACCKAKELKATSSTPPRLRRRADGGEPRPTGSTARRCFARYWRSSAANLGCARWSRRRHRGKKIAAASVASARC